jgi:SAM-dependent methyltransferase
LSKRWDDLNGGLPQNPTMPPVSSARQPEHRLVEWLQQGKGRRLAAEAQRQTIPELTRVFGHAGLFLRPFSDYPPELSGNMLATVLTLGRRGEALHGQWDCLDEALPIGSGSLSLVYSLFVLDTSPTPDALIQEIARVLKPEGVALLVGLNHFSPSRMRWLGRAAGPSAAWIATHAREAGLEVLRRQALGPVWLGAKGEVAGGLSRPRLFDPLSAAQLLVLRRRETPLTPIRAGAQVVGLRPGISAG